MVISAPRRYVFTASLIAQFFIPHKIRHRWFIRFGVLIFVECMKFKIVTWAARIFDRKTKIKINCWWSGKDFQKVFHFPLWTWNLPLWVLSQSEYTSFEPNWIYESWWIIKIGTVFYIIVSWTFASISYSISIIIKFYIECFNWEYFIEKSLINTTKIFSEFSIKIYIFL